MDYYNGNDRILYIKQQGNWLPVGCLTSNSLSESAEMLATTTRDNDGWATSRPAMQTYSISFEGLQINTTIAGGTFTVASYDKLKLLKRSKILLDWKIQGATFPTVDYGKCYITEISEASAVDEFLSFSGSMVGYGLPKTKTVGEFVLNDGDPDVILTTNTDAEYIIKTAE
tara:strand:+ start:54 stop:566 length:513 start_codon:yes stop_codon:yes gene_type:complete